MSDVFVGRQPILEKDRSIFGYELLFRSNQAAGGANIASNIRATASVMTNTLNNIGLKQLIGERRGFINVDVEIMESGILDLLPPENTVLELLETVSITEDALALCKKMRQAGYSIALDDFVFDESYLPMFSVADYVKIDVLATPRVDLPGLAKELAKHHVKLLAEKVETREDFQYCRDLGFIYFQGYFFAKPSLVTAKSISPTHIALIELSNALSRDQEYSAIETLFKRNPELNFKLLRFINSASFYTNQKISSIRHAIALLGYRNLQKWVTLLLYSGEAEDIKASPLLERAAIRGRVKELLARKITNDQSFADSAFICGVLSLVDVLFQMPIDQILDELNLSAEICSALLTRDGLLGDLLSLVEKLETEDFNGIAEGLARHGLTIEHLFDMERVAIIEYENYEGTTV
jgi:c-di-GMP-related signal transduction protein